MDIKQSLLDVVSGTGEAGKTVVSVSHDIIKEGGATVGDLINIAFEIAKETGKDATELVRDIVVGAISAVLVTTSATETGMADVIIEAEKAAGGITEEGGEAVRQGIAEAKKILTEPLK